VGVGRERGTYQVSVLGEHEIGLDILHAQIDGQAVGLEGMFRQVPARCVCVCMQENGVRSLTCLVSS